MVVLVSSSTPTIKRYSAVSPIEHALVDDGVLYVHCEDGVNWVIDISNGSRKKS